MEQLLDAVIAVAVAAIPVLGAFLVQALRRRMVLMDAQIKSDIGSSNYYLAESLARKAVAAAEQTLGLDTGEKKQAFAKGLLIELAALYELPVTEAQINGFIEAAVLALKRKE